MPDVFTKTKRSEVMSRIRSRGNKDTELILASLFRRQQITGWRRHRQIRIADGGKPPFKVRPDFVFRQIRLAVFVDGCFWHVCPKHGTQPKSNAAFWTKKIANNQTRDRLVTKTLRKTGWRVIRIWEHELARKKQPALLRRLQKALAG